jgi:hypothetical protein
MTDMNGTNLGDGLAEADDGFGGNHSLWRYVDREAGVVVYMSNERGGGGGGISVVPIGETKLEQ